MVTLSLCMIVKNEEDTLARCLNSVREAVDEIIVVDTGSTDKTVEIAQNIGATIFDFKWRDDFSAARNFAFSKASCDYIMWLDADDVIVQSELKKLIDLKSTLDLKIKEVAAKYDVAFDEHGNVVLSYYRERIFLREANFKWKGAVHETISLLPDVKYSSFTVKHAKIHPTEKGRNLRIFEKLIQEGQPFEPRQQYYYGRELYYNGRLEESITEFSNFLKSDGSKTDKVGACLLLSKCYTSTQNKTAALKVLFESFLYDLPSSEVCCEIGLIFLNMTNYSLAAYWYLQALGHNQDGIGGAFVYVENSGYIPLIQLCVCYDKMGDYNKAFAFNEQAALLKPDSKAVKLNREYFKKMHLDT